MQPPTKSSNFDLNIILLITLICLSISFYQTGLGYSKLFGNWTLSFAFAFVLVLFMFLQNHRLRESIVESKSQNSLRGILGIYVILTLASLGGNFNSFYSKFMGTELMRQELEAKRDSLNGIQERAHSVLTNKEAEEFEADVNSKIEQLKLQINNEGNPGVGPKSKVILDELQTKLGTTFTDLQAKSLAADDLKDIGSQYAIMIKEALTKKLGNMNQLQRNQLVADINTKVKSTTAILDEAAHNPSDIVKSQDAVTKAIQDYKYIGNRTFALSANPFKYDDKLEAQNSRLGEIDHAIRSGLAHLGSWGTWLALFISLLIDFIPPMMILGLTRPEEASNTDFKQKARPGVTILNN